MIFLCYQTLRKLRIVFNLTTLRFQYFMTIYAPVVQWIEHWSPEPKIWVRLPAGVPVSLQILTFVEL